MQSKYRSCLLKRLKTSPIVDQHMYNYLKFSIFFYFAKFITLLFFINFFKICNKMKEISYLIKIK